MRLAMAATIKIASVLAVATVAFTGCTVHSTAVSPAVEKRLKAHSVPARKIGLRILDVSGRYKMRVFSADLAPGPVCIPMEKSYGGLPALRVRLNGGTPFSMIADTGAQLCVVEPKRVLDAKAMVFASEETPIRVTGIGGEEKAWLARFEHANLGPLKLSGLVAVLRREKTEIHWAGLPVGQYEVNLLGSPVIAGFRYVTFDYAGSRFVFSPGTTYTPTRNAHRIPLAVHDNLFYVPLRIGKHTVSALVDTGAKDQIFLNEKLVRAWGLEKNGNGGGTYRAVGLGGISSGRTFHVPLVFIGATPVRDVAVDTSTGAWQARIGSDMLKKWRVTFDFEHGMLWLESNSKSFSESTL
jgi:predicted aspartyl protease